MRLTVPTGLTPLGLPEHLRAFSGFYSKDFFYAFGIKFLQYLPTQAFQLSMKGLERPKDLFICWTITSERLFLAKKVKTVSAPADDSVCVG